MLTKVFLQHPKGHIFAPVNGFQYLTYLMNTYSGNETVNLGTGKELTIKELTQLFAKIIGYTGKIRWDYFKLDGTPRKLLEVSKLERLGYHYVTELEDIRLAYADF